MRRRIHPEAVGARQDVPPEVVRDAIAAIALSDDTSTSIPPLAEADPEVWADVFADTPPPPPGPRRRRREKPQKERRGDRKSAARLARDAGERVSGDTAPQPADPFMVDAGIPRGDDEPEPTLEVDAIPLPPEPTEPHIAAGDDEPEDEALVEGSGAALLSRRAPGPRVLARRRARRRARLRFLGTIAVIVLAAVALYGAWRLLPRGGGSDAADTPVATAPSAGPAPTSDRVGVAITNAEGRATTVVVFGVAPSGDGYGLVLPGATFVDIPGFDFKPIERVPEFGGADLLRSSLENFLGIPVTGAAILEEDALAALAGEGVTVTVPADITAESDDGTLQLVFGAGTHVMDGPTFAEYVTYSEDGQIAQAGRVEASLSAVFAAGFPIEAVAEWPELAALVPALGEPEFTLLPVDARGIEGQEEIFEADRDAIQEILDRKAPQTVAGQAPGDRVRVEVLNGNGAVGITAPISEQLIELGYQVVRTDNADRFDYAETTITVYDEALVESAREIRELLGVGQVILSRAAPSYVDVTILLGGDLGAGATESTPAGDAG